VIWAMFHCLTTLPMWLAERAGAADLRALPWVSSAYAYDIVRLVFYAAALLVIFWRVGVHMQRVSAARQSVRRAGNA
jgi:hypothetical protein